MKEYKFPSFTQYDFWYWNQHGTHATRAQYTEAKQRVENYVKRAEELCQK